MNTQSNVVSLDPASDHGPQDDLPHVPRFVLSQTEQAAESVRATVTAPTPAQPASSPELSMASDDADPSDTMMQSLKIDHEEERIRSFLADGEVVEGNLRLKNGIRIAGTVTGRVDCENGTVIVEKTGIVSGGISTPSRIIVDGTVGDPEKSECTNQDAPSIRTPGLLAVLNNGKVFGCYQYGRIATYDDATLEGLGKKIKS